MLKKLVDISLGKLGQTTNSGLPPNLKSEMMKEKGRKVSKVRVKRKSLMPELSADNY